MDKEKLTKWLDMMANAYTNKKFSEGIECISMISNGIHLFGLKNVLNVIQVPYKVEVHEREDSEFPIMVSFEWNGVEFAEIYSRESFERLYGEKEVVNE